MCSPISCDTRWACLPGNSFRGSKWSLRVNPSSGNLHPTRGRTWSSARSPASARRRRSITTRPIGTPPSDACALGMPAWESGGWRPGMPHRADLIHWREAWKYGETRVSILSTRPGSRRCGDPDLRRARRPGARIRPDWSHADIASLTGIDRGRRLCRRRARRAGVPPRNRPDGQPAVVQVSVAPPFSTPSAAGRLDRTPPIS
jgi:hypothetical protein